MSITDKIRVVPRSVVGTYLRAGRLPLTVAERMARQQGNEKWAPTVAYERLQAGVETRVGQLLRDDDLAVKGQLRQERVEQLRRAAKLEAAADQQREIADETFEQRRKLADRTRTEAGRKAEQRERELERRADKREREARQKATKKAAAAGKVKKQQDEAIEKRERVAKSGALAQESEALAAEKAALEADRALDLIQETLEGEHEARKTS
jgi:hypothetical protein